MVMLYKTCSVSHKESNKIEFAFFLSLQFSMDFTRIITTPNTV
jgi:hypothetical protein